MEINLTPTGEKASTAMNTTKQTHTPGPWTVGTSHDGFCTVTDGTKTICTVGAADLFPGIEADARLIASAPDLLAALKLAAILHPHNVTFSQAIAKAEGAQP